MEAVNRLVGRMSDLITVMTGGTVTSMVGGAQWASTQVSGALAGAVQGTAWDAPVGALAGKVRGLGADATTAAADIGRNLGGIDTGPAWTRVNDVGGYVDDWLPWKASEGARDVSAALGAINVQSVKDKVYDIGHNWLEAYLPTIAGVGVDGVNRALDRVDVASVQDAVGDIGWEFEQGIPNAADSGMDLVNASMDIAEGAIDDVAGASADVSNALRTDIPAATNVAGGAIYDFAVDAVDYLGDIEAAATAAAWGRSPTGIKEIGVAAYEVLPAFRALAQQGLIAFDTIEAMSAATAAVAAGELLAIPEAADQALWDMNNAFDDALGQLAMIDVDLARPFQTMADEIADLANQARARWDTVLAKRALGVGPLSSEPLSIPGAGAQQQTINVYLDGREIASVVAKNLPSVVDAIVGV